MLHKTLATLGRNLLLGSINFIKRLGLTAPYAAAILANEASAVHHVALKQTKMKRQPHSAILAVHG
jgi:hypothetical protein